MAVRRLRDNLDFLSTQDVKPYSVFFCVWCAHLGDMCMCVYACKQINVYVCAWCVAHLGDVCAVVHPLVALPYHR